jgi:hypothetical protein
MLDSRMDILNLLSNYICETQSDLALYTFHASEKHKKVKDLLHNINATKSSEPYDNSLLEKLHDNVSDLDTYLYQKFKETFIKTFDCISHFFGSRYSSKFTPRACVKVIIGDELVTLVRQPSFHFEQNIKLVTNSAFKEILHSKNYYLCNNIPEAIESGNYENTKIDKEKVMEYNRRRRWEKVFLSSQLFQKDEDIEWVSCWKEPEQKITGEHTLSVRNFYKSTLVIPMSLSTKKLTPDFLNHFQFNPETVSERVVFGFLCFDHPRIRFFIEKKDKDFGYIVADILSLYIIQMQTYTFYSKSYLKADDLLRTYAVNSTKNQ